MSSTFVRCLWTRLPKDRPVPRFEWWLVRVGQVLDVMAAVFFVALIFHVVKRWCDFSHQS